MICPDEIIKLEKKSLEMALRRAKRKLSPDQMREVVDRTMGW